MSDSRITSQYHQRVASVGLGILGAHGMLTGEAQGDRYRLGGWQSTFVASLSGTIAQGSSEIQRNIVGERALGLPKERSEAGPTESA